MLFAPWTPASVDQTPFPDGRTVWCKVLFRLFLVVTIPSLLACRSDAPNLPRGANGASQANPRQDRNVKHQTERSSQAVRASRATAWFTEVVRFAGIDFRHQSGASDKKPFPAANGSGVAALDFDLDGLCDLYFANGTPFPLDAARQNPRDGVWRNLSIWRFVNVAEQTNLGHPGYTAGVAVGDYNSDGFPDIYLACFGVNRLYRNQGDGTFERVETAAGVADNRWAASAAFLDADGDGLLDLYVCNYAKWEFESDESHLYCGDRVRKIRVYCSPSTVEPERDLYYHNQGDGAFRDRTAAVGLDAQPGRGQGVVAADVNNDGAIDLYVGNDLNANLLFLNDGRGVFHDTSELSGSAYDHQGVMQAGMGVDAEDINGDGRPELFVTNFRKQHNALYENAGDHIFQDVSHRSGLATESLPWVGWGTVLVDFNLDGWSDVLVTNGHVDDNRHLMGQDSPYQQPPQLWKNRVGNFKYIGAAAGEYFAHNHVGRGLATADFDNDGDRDVVISHMDALPALLRNDRIQLQSTPADNTPNPAVIVLRLVGTRSNRDAVGAAITLIAGDRRKMQQVKGGGSYLSAHDPDQSFAILAEDRKVHFEVRWPRGLVSLLTELKPGHRYLIVEPLEPNQNPTVFSHPINEP